MNREPSAAPGARKAAQPGKLRAIVLAVIVHAVFFGFIVFGVSWQSRPMAPVEAELWDKLPPMKSAEVKPAPEPPKVEPKPEPKPEPPKVAPKPEPPKPEAKPEPPKPDPEIALKAEREKKEREKRERLEKQREEEKRKKEKEAAEKKKQEAEKKQREKEEADRRKREEDERRRQEEAQKAAAERARAEAASARQREFDQYVSQIRAKIRGKANVPDTVPTGTEVHVRLRILPGGDVLDIAVTKPSGNPAYDSAIERAIRSAQPLPVPPANSELFPRFRDLNLQIKHER